MYRPDQLWLVYQLESAKNRHFLHSEANWTATYRRDSTLATPYGWWRPDSDPSDCQHFGHLTLLSPLQLCVVTGPLVKNTRLLCLTVMAVDGRNLSGSA